MQPCATFLICWPQQDNTASLTNPCLFFSFLSAARRVAMWGEQTRLARPHRLLHKNQHEGGEDERGCAHKEERGAPPVVRPEESGEELSAGDARALGRVG